MHKTAVISPCGRYRYQLGRHWEIGATALWIMLNPSTADATVDDNTIKRCIAFSQREGFGSLLVGNIYAFCSTDPRALSKLDAIDAFGPDNDLHLRQMALRASRVICAWGSHAAPEWLCLQALPRTPGGMWCLGKTKSGSPKHPLYLPANTPLEPFP